jgi:hypothetical protein
VYVRTLARACMRTSVRCKMQSARFHTLSVNITFYTGVQQQVRATASVCKHARYGLLSIKSKVVIGCLEVLGQPEPISAHSVSDHPFGRANCRRPLGLDVAEVARVPPDLVPGEHKA